MAGVGNVLRGDDGFGVAVAERLQERPLPLGVKVIDVGIGGIHMVQELFAGTTDALIVADAMDLEKAPGTVMVVRPEVPDVIAMHPMERRDQLADMHYAVPARALMLARGLGVLPHAVWFVGCQPDDAGRVGEGLSPAVAAAVDVAVDEIVGLISQLDIGLSP